MAGGTLLALEQYILIQWITIGILQFYKIEKKILWLSPINTINSQFQTFVQTKNLIQLTLHQS